MVKTSPPNNNNTNNHPSLLAGGGIQGKKQKKSGRFLKALHRIAQETPKQVAKWSEDGKQFDVLDPISFDLVLRNHFPNAHPRTFFRQLSHYKITKLNVLNGGGDETTPGSFSLKHSLFSRDDPDRVFEIQCRNRKRYNKGEKMELELEDEEEEETVVISRESSPSAAVAMNKLEHDVLAFEVAISEMSAIVTHILEEPRFKQVLDGRNFELLVEECCRRKNHFNEG